ncbi:ATP-dependent 23S rRNA helicase DbpA [hydrothermal vent metagenome]|uniref:ATP-dependent 23S rRNA helicase DbpA n=1 Tax=hydrothermal vent metagenome TaxID=652676 RepID=A0A3B0XF05_9ZZZZ
MPAFSSLKLSNDFLANLNSLNYKEMTEIQCESIPKILAGEDIRAQAKTGSGKTAAFGIGLLVKLDPQNYLTQSLVLCPTRELADQVGKELRRLARAIGNIKISTLCGGTPIVPQYASLEHHPHIVVGTPGRILKHLQKNTLNLNNLTTLVLDEADRMLDMGFSDDILRIIEGTPDSRQTLLFSATFPQQINKISKTIQNSPIEIKVESLHDENKIKQIFYEIEKNTRTQTLILLLQHYAPQSSVIFCNRKQQCKDLAEELWEQGFHAVALHGDLEQKERDQKLVQFSNKSSSILIATDVAARGLDIKDLQAVINYELSNDPEIHIHRIGRTGRAGNEGLALSLFTPSETPKLNAIEDYQKNTVNTVSATTLNSPNNWDSQQLKPPMNTIHIYAGRKNKIRAGDILGALTKNTSLSSKHIGKIDIFDTLSYVAVENKCTNQALTILSNGKIKGRQYRVRKI